MHQNNCKHVCEIHRPQFKKSMVKSHKIALLQASKSLAASVSVHGELTTLPDAIVGWARVRLQPSDTFVHPPKQFSGSAPRAVEGTSNRIKLQKRPSADVFIVPQEPQLQVP